MTPQDVPQDVLDALEQAAKDKQAVAPLDLVITQADQAVTDAEDQLALAQANALTAHQTALNSATAAIDKVRAFLGLPAAPGGETPQPAAAAEAAPAGQDNPAGKKPQTRTFGAVGRK